MTKLDLVDVVYRCHGGISRRESSRIVECLLARMKGEFAAGGQVQIAGLGRLEVVGRRSRKGRNPKTGETIRIPAKRSLVFRPSRVLVERLNRDGVGAGGTDRPAPRRGRSSPAGKDRRS
ncbi:MAG: HU family DNA-binding protein [Acidobacteriota bacterium]